MDRAASYCPFTILLAVYMLLICSGALPVSRNPEMALLYASRTNRRGVASTNDLNKLVQPSRNFVNSPCACGTE